MPLITVCTATYNFDKYLHRVYDSLRLQTINDFEWIIVDDASIDNTEEIVQKWISEGNGFDIVYIKLPENRGKMYATNQGAKAASGDFFLDIGGDDALKPYALDHFIDQWNKIDNSVKPTIAGLVTNVEDQFGNMVGTNFPESPLICDYFELKFKYKIRGDKCSLYKTDVMLQYPFYDDVDRHVIHSATFFDIAYEYKLYCFEDSLYIYYRNEDKNTLSKKTHKLRFIKGRQFYAEKRINKYFNKIPSLKFKLYSFISYIRYSAHSDITFLEMFKRINRPKYKFIFTLVFPTGYLIFLSDRLRKRV